jgi:hypothetical protein
VISPGLANWFQTWSAMLSTTERLINRRLV